MKFVFKPVAEGETLGFKILAVSKEDYLEIPTSVEDSGVPSRYKGSVDYIQPIREDDEDGTFYFLLPNQTVVKAGTGRFIKREKGEEIKEYLSRRLDKIRMFQKMEEEEREAARVARQKFLDEKRDFYRDGGCEIEI